MADEGGGPKPFRTVKSSLRTHLRIHPSVVEHYTIHQLEECLSKHRLTLDSVWNPAGYGRTYRTRCQSKGPTIWIVTFLDLGGITVIAPPELVFYPFPPQPLVNVVHIREAKRRRLAKKTKKT